MITPPGSKKFKLVKLSEPNIDKATGVKYEFVCPELQNESCSHCYRGWLYVASGLKDGIYDVYRFPCKCSGMPNGLEFWQTIDETRYRNRPVDVEYSKDELPGYVFIHPIHNAEFRQVTTILKQIAQKLYTPAEEELPF